MDLLIYMVQTVLYESAAIDPLMFMEVNFMTYKIQIFKTLTMASRIQGISSLLYNFYKNYWFKRFKEEALLYTKSKWPVEVKRLMNGGIMFINACYISLSVVLIFF